jgi:hypothetical protein
MLAPDIQNQIIFSKSKSIIHQNVQNKFGLFDYQLQRKIRSDGQKTVLLKGTRQAVEEAGAELVRMANEEMAKNEKAKELKKMRNKLAEFDQSGNEENCLNETTFVYSSDEGEKVRERLRKGRGHVKMHEVNT